MRRAVPSIPWPAMRMRLRRRKSRERMGGMSSDSLIHEAVELAVKRNPHLVLEPYYQIKAAARILAEALINSPVVGMEPYCSCESPHGGYRCLNCYLPLRKQAEKEL